VEGATTCVGCKAGEHAVIKNMTNYALYNGTQAECKLCPKNLPSLFKCQDGIVAWETFDGENGVYSKAWYDPNVVKATRMIDEHTDIYPCFNEVSCLLEEEGGDMLPVDVTNTSTRRRRLTQQQQKLSSGTKKIICNAKLGYRGPLCGDCIESEGFMRSGFVCGKCQEESLNILAVIGMAILLFFIVVYIVAIRSTHRDLEEYGGIIRRIAFSYLQMLGVLGIFKARGTKTFNEIVGQSSQGSKIFPPPPPLPLPLFSFARNISPAS
jgi:hypothetical protein